MTFERKLKVLQRNQNKTSQWLPLSCLSIQWLLAITRLRERHMIREFRIAISGQFRQKEVASKALPPGGVIAMEIVP